MILFLAMCMLLAGWVPLFLLCGAIFGLSSFPVMPVLLELLTRKFENIPYYVSNTVFFVSSQIFTVIMQLILGKIFDKYEETGGVFCVVAILYLMLFMLPFLKEVDNEVS